MEYTQTVTATALAARHTSLEIKNTLIKCQQMYNSKVQPDGCKKDESAKRYANFTKYTKKKHTYASLISLAMDSLEDLR
tara:strand:+ start:517 stop:753 length:237 start_codon:yes stop_codon:yes gene_type:complete